ncbi:hypothetical protein C1645_759276 [Glomus cerebriforme]|uniref:Uncharacterized protein n=1 Tax=Glomus cerebriforme TaxID=658196 RepID=A0A397TCU1_9GLOM|nr:hypothetical protein C1645_759276 [Glomus cerebriforme]
MFKETNKARKIHTCRPLDHMVAISFHYSTLLLPKLLYFTIDPLLNNFIVFSFSVFTVSFPIFFTNFTSYSFKMHNS